ncbi:hypothetical protein HYDPIDRAFT_186216 [Hydnomerulius pinastri MD-312]|nr:hypothetical protein HYDPIDRAFT_186216 [Hydnomerulius pinastri MD-312]
MPFLSRRSVEPLRPFAEREGFAGSVSPGDTPRSRAASDGVFRRVSTLFAGRKRTPSKSSPSQAARERGGIGFIRSHPLILSRTSSHSSPPSSPEIRRPSGLGRRASSLESTRSVVSEGYGRSDAEAGVNKGYYSSLPNLLDGPFNSPNTPVPHRTAQRAQRNATSGLPGNLWEAILSRLPKRDLPATALVSRTFCSASRLALYRSLDFQSIAEPRVEKLCAVLADNSGLGEQVVALACHFWPTSKPCSADGNVDLVPADGFLRALQNMRNLKILTLQSFTFLLHHLPSLPFVLTKLTILDESITQSQLTDIRSWLVRQSCLESLSFPNLIEFAGSDDSSSPSQSEIDDPHLLHDCLPHLRWLHAPPQISTAICSSMKHPLKRITLDVHDTLYTGLRPGAVLRALKGVQEMHLIFGHEVDKRTVEKFLGAAGGILAEEDGSGGLESLDVEVLWMDNDAAETLYAIITSIISRFRGLLKLKLTSPYRSFQAEAPVSLSIPLLPALPSPTPTGSSSTPSSLSASAPPGGAMTKEFVACGTEKTHAKAWTKQCPSLCDIQFDFSAPDSDADIELCGVWFRRKATNARNR